MLKKIRLERFKNFKEAELTLGNFTILVGTNATGKSNIGDALRFLHGISRGYNLAEILGEKWGQGGFLEWEGIRGGKQNITFQNSPTFAIEVTLYFPEEFECDEEGSFIFTTQDEYELIYRLEVNPGINGKQPKVIEESLYYEKSLKLKIENLPNNSGKMLLQIYENSETKKIIEFPTKADKPLLMDSDLIKNIFTENKINESISHDIDFYINEVSGEFINLQFLDLFPDAMRRPSNPGQNILGDRGENLSSVLQAICENPTRKIAVLEWLKALTPMDATDLEFVTDITGKILLVLIEANGQKIPIISASDGTLRFLAIIAALFNESDDLPNFSCYFLEELDNGLHPTRLHLLIELIETRVKQTNLQIIATTHSSQLLRLLSYETLQNTSLTYRLENQPDAKIKRIFDISPETETLIKEQSLARLHESGWLENIMEFSQEEE
ncbi:AAA family ATPase [Planktothrix sp. FACHB-1365]|uniref:AAA family ATPase n=1 Tax=Planktothrix sp. FACHB-1365 TaxID=2692855 RepID=UPI00168940B2|nr:ATP-binding protein [Planktothrix sp. FACHB-1365]MBD2481933.1 AAA family ATPase [Planktothrix sp. FACHB-1365]